MRIVSGSYKGRKILLPKDNKTRPLKDLTKESIFNLIIHSKFSDVDIQNSNILDLFSGVGSFGIECISRGAKFVTFVENYKFASEILSRNIRNFELIKKSEILDTNLENVKNFNFLEKKYDIVFIDPPFQMKNLSIMLNKIFVSKILNKKNIIIIHRNKETKEEFHVSFRILKTKVYGKSKIIFGSI